MAQALVSAEAGSPAPRVSVVIPTYNRARVLEHCLRAIAAQTFDSQAFEIIVIDDGSRDETPEVCQHWAARFRSLRVHRQQNLGPAAARNAGIHLARAAIVAFTDDDCIPPPDWLARIADAFEREPDLGGVGGLMITPPHQWIPLTHHSDLTAPGDGTYSRFIGTNNAAYRREVLLRAGTFDEHFRHVSVEDAELYLRVQRIAKTRIDPYLYVMHPPRTMTFIDALRGFIRFYRGYLALQKAYPSEFVALYGGSAEGAVLKGRSWRTRARLYAPGMLRHPWRGLQFLAYLGCSRAAVLGLAVARRLRGPQ